MLIFKGRVYVPNQMAVKQKLLDEFHRSPYAAHPRYQKPFSVIKINYFSPSMRKDITEYLAKCLECQQLKVEHQHHVGLLHPLPIPEWKWEIITLDFITGLPKIEKQHDSIMVVMDKLSKFTHFIPAKSTYKTVEVANILMREIFRLHGLPKVVILKRGVMFTSTF